MSRPRIPSRSAAASASASTRACSSGSSCSSAGSGLASTSALSSSSSSRGEQGGGDLLRRVEPPRHRVAGVGEVEAGEAVGPVAGDADPERLHPLERGAARRGSTSPLRRRCRCRCARARRGRPTRPRSRAPGGARRRARRSRTAGSRPARRGGRSRRRSSRRWRRRHRDRQVARAALGDVVAGGDRLQRGLVEPDAHDAVEQRDRGRGGAVRRARSARARGRPRRCAGAGGRGRSASTRARRRARPLPARPRPLRRSSAQAIVAGRARGSRAMVRVGQPTRLAAAPSGRRRPAPGPPRAHATGAAAALPARAAPRRRGRVPALRRALPALHVGLEPPLGDLLELRRARAPSRAVARRSRSGRSCWPGWARCSTSRRSGASSSGCAHASGPATRRRTSTRARPTGSSI